MAVNISQRTAQIRTAVHGKDVRENLAGGLEDIAAAENQFETNMMNLEATYQGTLEKRQADYEAAITKQQNDYESKINNDFAEYKADITKQENDFEVAITKQQNDYETKINGEFDDYKVAITKQQNDYESKINGEFEAYKDDINKQQSDYETKVNKEWSDYKAIMDADEVIRKQNEDTRQANEQTRETNETARQSNETTRQQNEIVRQNNETTRIENETARETAFAGMQHVDANLELSTARGTFSTLEERLNNSEGETLENKELITIPHGLNCYPDVRCICGYYGAGVGGAGSNAAGGTESYLIRVKICYLDTNNIKIYVPKHYLVKSPVLQRISDTKYILSSDDVTETKSMLINIQEVA